MTRLYSTFDPAALGASLALEQANTIVVTSATADIHRMVKTLYPKSSRQWFAEFAFYGDAAIANAVSVGVAKAASPLTGYVGEDADSYGYRAGDGTVYNNGSSVASVATAEKGDIIGVWVSIGDGTTVTVKWFLNGVLLRTQTLPDSGPWYLAVTISSATADSLRAWINTGQRAFEYPVAGVEGWYDLPAEVPTVRISSEDWITPADDVLPNVRWQGRLADDGIEIVSELKFWPDTDGSGRVRTTQGSAVRINVLNSDGALDRLLESDVRDLDVSIKTIEPGDSLDDAEGVAEMIINDVEAIDSSLLRLTLSSSMGLYDQPLQRLIFPPSADEVVAGKVWPTSLGAARQTTPTLVDPVERIYAVHDRGLPAIGYVRDKGAPLDPTAGPPGYVVGDDFRTIVLETNPEGKLTADVSSIGAGIPPGTSDDIWLEYGNPFAEDSAGDIVGFDSNSGASYALGGKVLLTSSGLGSTPHVSLSTAQMLVGRSYRYKIVVDLIPPANAYGQPVVGIFTAGGTPILVITTAGTYTGVITSPYTFSPRLQLESALTSNGAIISTAYLLEIPDAYEPAELNAITLTDFFTEIVENRFGQPQSAWSRGDTEAIDTITGYAGIGFNVTDPITVRDALEMSLSSYTACAYIDDDNVLRVVRLTDPDGETSMGEITEDDLLDDLSCKPDLAPGLSTQMQYRRNWTVLNKTDFVSDFIVVPMSTRQALSQPYQGIAASATQLGPMYSHAVYADPQGALLDVQADAQAEIDRIVSYYSVPRYFYETQLSTEIPLKLGQVWTLDHPRYGLAGGKKLMVCKIIRRPLSGTVGITLRG